MQVRLAGANLEVGMPRSRYPTDLTEAQWARLEPLLERPVRHGGRPRKYPRREIVNALLYVLRGGVSWRALPHDFPPWESVYDHFRRWKTDGTLERVHEVLRSEVRQKDGRGRTPSVLILDSQSVQTTEKGGPGATMLASG
jgi:transposase